MSRQIIVDDEGFPLEVNTFAGGKGRGECVQITILNTGVMEHVWDEHSRELTTLTRDMAVKFFELAAKRLRQQIKEDEADPPWWQQLSESKE